MQSALTSQYIRRATVDLVFLMCLGSGITFTILTAVYWYPKSISLEGGGRLFYRGFGLETTEGTVFGRQHTRAIFPITVPEDGFGEVDFTRTIRKHGTAHHPFVAHYPGGSFRAMGIGQFVITEGMVGREGDLLPPSVDFFNSGDCDFFHPDGNAHSVVRDGTGVETFWTHYGVKVWELRLKKYERQKLTTWHRNGQLSAEYAYKEGKKHGLVRFYGPSGDLEVTILYEDGLVKERRSQGIAGQSQSEGASEEGQDGERADDHGEQP